MPEKIGPYKVEALLDKGGMSTLFLATHPDTKEPVAIKVLSQKYISNPEVVNRFLNEAEIISMTDHPNIIKTYGHGEWERGLYIAMEYIEGISLRKYILKNPVSLKKALVIIIDIAYALCHLHTHGVIHRDLKPENILVLESGEIKVIDFGIAQLLTEKVIITHPSKQRLIGTPIYISPEQKENPEMVSYPSDIYSLGVIAYELILGKLSHGYIHLSLLPSGMQPILNRCLQPNPNQRYQDVVGFITDVSSYLNSPSMQKDRPVGDRFSEFSEELERMQTTLIPSSPPRWENIEIGISSFRDLRMTGVYYDFFELSPENYGIIIAESSLKGAGSVISMACLRGIVRTLQRLTKEPIELVARLNEILLEDRIDPIFNLNYLVLNPKKNFFSYVSLGYGNLWYIGADQNPVNCSHSQIPLGTQSRKEIKEESLPWNANDIIILNTFSSFEKGDKTRWNIHEDLFIEAIKDNITLPVQKQVDNILRKIRITASDLTKGRILTLMSIKKSK